jgi:soluble lytic murein transglycosylase-like protein
VGAARQLAPLLRATARAHGLPEALLQAVVEAESDFDPGAVSPRGAVGLMQLMPATARALRVPDARDPGANLDGGARYLKDLLAQHDHDLVLALAAYNAGPGAVRQAGGVPPFAETRRYVPRVLARYHQLQAGGRE